MPASNSSCRASQSCPLVFPPHIPPAPPTCTPTLYPPDNRRARIERRPRLLPVRPRRCNRRATDRGPDRILFRCRCVLPSNALCHRTRMHNKPTMLKVSKVEGFPKEHLENEGLLKSPLRLQSMQGKMRLASGPKMRKLPMAMSARWTNYGQKASITPLRRTST